MGSNNHLPLHSIVFSLCIWMVGMNISTYLSRFLKSAETCCAEGVSRCVLGPVDFLVEPGGDAGQRFKKQI